MLGPVLSGALQLTSNFVTLLFTAVTVGAFGFLGASVLSVTVITNGSFADIARVPCPLVALIVKT